MPAHEDRRLTMTPFGTCPMTPFGTCPRPETLPRGRLEGQRPENHHGRDAGDSALRLFDYSRAHATCGICVAGGVHVGVRHSGCDLAWPQRCARPTAWYGFFQRLCGRHLRARRPAASAYQSRPAIRPRTGDFRDRNAVLWLALSAVLPIRRGIASIHALRASPYRVAGSLDRTLSFGDSSDPGRAG